MSHDKGKEPRRPRPNHWTQHPNRPGYFWNSRRPHDPNRDPPHPGAVVARPAHEIDDHAGMPPRAGGGGGFFLGGGTDQVAVFDDRSMVLRGRGFPQDQADDVSDYFGGQLRIFHRGNGVGPQEEGAPLPAIPVNQPALDYTPDAELAWRQRGHLPSQPPRRQERQIMGQDANAFIEAGGIAPRPYSAHAHSRPDHSHPPDRERREIRVPGYVGANQHHSAIEGATRMLANQHGEIDVYRRLGPEIPGGSGLPVGLHMGFRARRPDGEVGEIEHFQNYYTGRGARHGDATGIMHFLNHRHDEFQSRPGVNLFEAGKRKREESGELERLRKKYRTKAPFIPSEHPFFKHGFGPDRRGPGGGSAGAMVPVV